MKISAVITLYNKAPYIERCLRSVMAQTHLPCEIIVVNDVSSDGGDIIAEKTLKKSPVPWVLHNRENRGGATGPAENTGVRISRGKFIAFLDGDDEWAPGHLENIVRLIDRYPNADAYSSSRELRKGSTCLPCPYALKSKRNDTHVFDLFEFLSARHFEGSPFRIPGMAFRAESMDDVGGFSNAPRSQNIDFLFRFFISGKKAVWSPYVGLIIHRVPDSIMAKYPYN